MALERWLLSEQFLADPEIRRASIAQPLARGFELIDSADQPLEPTFEVPRHEQPIVGIVLEPFKDRRYVTRDRVRFFGAEGRKWRSQKWNEGVFKRFPGSLLQHFRMLSPMACQKRVFQPFVGLTAPEAFAKRMNEDNRMFVYEEQGEIMAVIELKENRHVAMLFVAPDRQRRGIGRELVQVALSHRHVQSITVSASLPSVSAYEKYGFEVIGPEEVRDCVIFP